jgi:hypothetical protein
VYNSIADNAGRVVKTVREVETSVCLMLCQLGTSKAFADRIAAYYAGPGRAGDDLYAQLLQVLASLPPPASVGGLKPAKAVMDMAAQVVDQEAHLFTMRDSTKPGIDIMGEVRGGELEFMVRAQLKDTGERGMLSGRYMFERMLAHFAAQKTVIDVFLGNWTYESNIEMFNRLSRVGLTPEEAAAGTFTGEWAGAHGYSNVTDVVAEPSTASPGAYTKVTAKFRK